MGPPKTTPSKQKNTLFSYFAKSPASSQVQQHTDKQADVLSPKKSPNRPKVKPEQKNATVKGLLSNNHPWCCI